MKSTRSKKVSFDKRCLISCDLDGTLLNNKSQISQYSKKVIKKLTDMGHIFCINTARPYNAADKFYFELNLKTPIVCHNGAFMFCPLQSDFPLTSWFISKEIVKQLFSDKNIRKYLRNAAIDAEKRAYFLYRNNYTVNQLKKIINDFGIYTTGDIRLLNGDISKLKDTAYAVIMFPKNDEATMDLVNAIKTKIPTVITSIWKVDKVGTVVKVSSPYCSKGMALQLLSSYYGIPEGRCFSFGDGLDDADMLKFASNGYAMKNGANEAQIKSNFITKYTNEQDGVARTLNKVLKLGFKDK